jgi:hypothetical protein
LGGRFEVAMMGWRSSEKSERVETPYNSDQQTRVDVGMSPAKGGVVVNPYLIGRVEKAVDMAQKRASALFFLSTYMSSVV